MSDAESVVARVKRRTFVVSGVLILGSFLLGPRRGASLTICAAVVISSFLALEKILERLDPGRAKPGFRTLVPLLLVTEATFAVVGVVLWLWLVFVPLAEVVRSRSRGRGALGLGSGNHSRALGEEVGARAGASLDSLRADQRPADPAAGPPARGEALAGDGEVPLPGRAGSLDPRRRDHGS